MKQKTTKSNGQHRHSGVKPANGVFADDAFLTQGGEGLVAIVDIGSNSIRMVVYDTSRRMPAPIFHDKVTCVLASGLYKTGKLKTLNMQKALSNLARFAALIEAMQVERVMLLATAAVREAANGKDFARQIEVLFAQPVAIISGEEEARLSAFGVMSCIHDADGVVGDLGGGSLELAEICHHRLFNTVSLPLGHKRLQEMSKAHELMQSAKNKLTGQKLKDRLWKDKPKAVLPKAVVKNQARYAQELVEEALRQISWVKELKGRTFYAVGGQWRRLALQHMRKTGYALQVIHHYSVEQDDMADFLTSKNFKPVKEAKSQGVGVYYAGMVLAGILKIGKPAEVIFSGTSLREGYLYDLLHQGDYRFDSLLADCYDIAQRTSRFSAFEKDLTQWLKPVVAHDPDYNKRLCQAAALLWQFCGNEHPDFRANIVFDRILHLPIAGADHPSRIFLALALYARYAGHLKGHDVHTVKALLADDDVHRALVLGLALRLAHTISGGVPTVLRRTRLHIEGDRLVLSSVKQGLELITGDSVQKHLADLAQALNLQPVTLEASTASVR